MSQFTVYRNKNPRCDLGAPAGDLAGQRDTIISAIDFLLSGF